MSIGRITNSILSGSNENNLSLATLNFDFSLVKLAPPKEFEPLASALSSHRRRDAEEGQPHRTARRLGALFEDIIPSTPKLIDAFGQRVSQIVQTPGINPRGSTTHGPFEKFVGADGTTLWAAATSGISSIGVYLLSCILAQAWDSKQATALWVELVKQRQLEIESAYENNHKVSISTLFSARQDISREDLARWDNSARSWLRSANQAMTLECNQLMLITKNLQLPIVTTTSTYASVLNVWKETMIGVEALLSDQPVEISNGSLFLAFSSWYLFPDLIVLGTTPPTHVKFSDKLFPPGGKCTVRRHTVGNDHRGGIRWSLAFSHLRYYGDPVVAQTTPDFSRVTFPELSLAILGHIFKEWHVSDRDQTIAAEWMVKLWNLVQSCTGQADEGSSSRFAWLRVLAQAAKSFLDPDPRAKQKNTQLIRYGRRRAKLFAVDPTESLLPFFGICTPLRLAALSQKNHSECGISFLRAMAKEMKLCEKETLIFRVVDGYQYGVTETASIFEVSTAIPHTLETKKRDLHGDPIDKRVHARWVISCNIEDNARVKSFMSKSSESGENCFAMVAHASKILDRYEVEFTWPATPNLYSPASTSNCCATNPPVTFRAIYGDWKFGIYIRDTDFLNIDPLRRHAESLAGKPNDISLSIKEFGNADINLSLLTDYLSFITRGADDKQNARAAHERDKYIHQQAAEVSWVGRPSLPDQFCHTLFTLELVDRVYSHLDGATIPLTILNQPLWTSAWVPKPICKPLKVRTWANSDAELIPAVPVALTRQQAFSCVAKFESGTVDLDPTDLCSTLALCSENSMFVAAVALLDPFEQPAAHEVRRIVGNISQPGISLLVAPEEPRIRNRPNQYTAVLHASYDFQRENNFAGTSLHLSFTDWRFPLEAGGSRTIDQDVLVVESVISVLDRGAWVADLDILCIDFENLSRVVKDCDRHDHDHTAYDLKYDYTSIDSWDELLDMPENVGVFRAHGNWAARLAAVSILSQQGQGHSIALFGTKKVCFKCLEAEREDNVDYLMDHESPLPSVCID
ncbi:hypothetical protein BDV11DRAFT_216830 [Aspergillus similis]